MASVTGGVIAVELTPDVARIAGAIGGENPKTIATKAIDTLTSGLNGPVIDVWGPSATKYCA